MEAIQRKWEDLKILNPHLGIIFSLLGMLLLVILVMPFITDRFLTTANIVNQLTQASIFLIMAVGMTLVMTTSGIDIAVGSHLGLTVSIIGIVGIGYGYPVWATILAGLVAAALGGAFNSVFIVNFKVPPIIVTLGTWTVFRGLAYVLTGGRLVFGFPSEFVWIARGNVLGIPVPVFLAGLAFIFGYILLHKTAYGSYLAALGGNEEAAMLAGINVRKVKFSVYVIAGLLTGLAAIITSARLDTAHPTAGIGYELTVISATVLGGTLLFGGRGLMIGTLIAVLFLQVLTNAMIMGGVGIYWQRVLFGFIFVLVVAIRTIRSEKQEV